MLTLRAVNDSFAAAGIQERLAKGKGYFYFVEGESIKWFSTSVMVIALNQLDLKGWHDAWSELSGKPSIFSDDNMKKILASLEE